MKSIIILIGFIIVINDLFTVFGQDFMVDLNNDFLNSGLVHTNEYRPMKKLVDKRNVTAIKPIPKEFKTTEIVSSKPGKTIVCRGMTAKLHKMGKEVVCKPRKTLVKLNPDPGYYYMPDVILIDRCDGRCGHESQSCMVIESTTTKVLVQRMQIGSLESPCYELDVEKHTRCKCGCDLMPNDCSFHQKYNEEECTCECKNIKEQWDCTLKDGMYWNRETCRCACAVEEETCSTGLMWIPSICRCAKVMMDDNNIY